MLFEICAAFFSFLFGNFFWTKYANAYSMNYFILLKRYQHVCLTPPRSLTYSICYSSTQVLYQFLDFFGSRIIIKSSLLHFSFVFHFPASNYAHYDHLSMSNWQKKKRQKREICLSSNRRREEKRMHELCSNEYVV